ncbi:transcriptional regulator LytR [Lentibacillus populi]|uniref:Transcriptional regulator LytR n=1 Tax=Lentibacillus populi TaxID=1827502 RepID=A0A9W5X721_9BACI|nr:MULTISPECIES: LCP family protein [Bacillaceae]MBT2216271.1 LCP family protein [Virgibacillus dakarensis]GGB57593.1 transcriptional regulator LytR [Lentibacillus populi]
MVEKRSDRRKKPRRRWLKISLAVILILVLGVGAYAYSIYHNAKETVNEKMHKQVTSIDPGASKKKIGKQKPLNILLLGVDKRKGDNGRSDALMVLSLDPKANKMQLISIPRDTRTEIVGKGSMDKINHAYAFGGTDMSVATVENFLGVELDYYVEMNMKGLSEMVDAVGGITLNNELDWYDEGYYKKGYHFSKGEISLNGPQTMGYVRMRHLDPNGDFGRTKRQRKVIEAIVDKGASVASVTKIDDMIDVLGNNMETNLDFDDMKSLLLHYKDVRQNTVSYMMQGTGQKIGGVYYLIVPDEEVAKVHGMIAEIKS